MTRSLVILLACVAIGGCATPADETARDESDLTETEAPDELSGIRAAVKDVDEEHIVFADDVAAPDRSAGTGARGEATSLYGVDWYQKWAGGKTADHDWANGSANGKRCMWASVARFEAIMKDAPPELAAFLAEYATWDGAFYNWNDDYSGKTVDGKPAFGDARGARIWAWRSNLAKWVSATARDGSCYLPTKAMVVAFVNTCKKHIAANDGEMQGCEVRSVR